MQQKTGLDFLKKKMKNKIFNISKLSKIIKKKKQTGSKIVLCHGVFDLVHYGHIAHFKNSKKFGDILVVTITADKFVNKGPNRPYFNQDLRKKFLSNFDFVDYVSEVNSPSAIEAIRQIKPDFYSKGKEYQDINKDITKKIKAEINEVKKNKGKIIYTDELTFSSSKILHDLELILSPEQLNEVKNIKRHDNFQSISEKFKKLKKLKILVIGEIILDKYTVCEPLGKSGKDPIMMFKKNDSNTIMGGSGAIANNLAQFCDNVKLISYLGKKSDYKKFVYKTLEKKIKKEFVYVDAPTILKEKFIDKTSGNKIVGFYNFDDSIMDNISKKKLKKILTLNIKRYDVVIVANYGHGLIDDEMANLISNKSKFLVVNSQINAANIFHHSLNMFKKSTCTIINEGELRHEMRDKHSNIELLMKKLCKIINSNYFVVTRGSEGSKLLDVKKNKIINSAAYTTKVVDKIGTGDTLMAVFAVLLKSTKNPSLSIFLSSIAASHNVQMMGNSVRLSPNIILKTLQHLI
ncbi:PfkB family carbohydrate kinase [Candidatus Pelagibacter sp.]|nr:PfkB family carbohydrate kinase [Candidatus Pelagibacter sp.]